MLTRGKYLYINSAGATKEVYSPDNPPTGIPISDAILRAINISGSNISAIALVKNAAYGDQFLYQAVGSGRISTPNGFNIYLTTSATRNIQFSTPYGLVLSIIKSDSYPRVIYLTSGNAYNITLSGGQYCVVNFFSSLSPSQESMRIHAL